MTQDLIGCPLKVGHSVHSHSAVASRELFEQLRPEKGDTVVFFASSKLDLTQILAAWPGNADELHGCTTSGEIGPKGYCDQSLVAICLSKNAFEVKPIVVPAQPDYSHLQLPSAEKFNHHFCISLLDGLSVQEEMILSILSRKNSYPLAGGSAGDDLGFKKTRVVCAGKIEDCVGVLLVCSTNLDVKIFKEQHFLPTETRMVTTKSDPSKRVVFELNGKPAAQEYARIIGVNRKDLDPKVFSKYPVMVKLGGEHYVRSIQTANEDDSLTFYCAIANGIVLRLASGNEILKSSLELHDNLAGEKNPLAVIVFECILRKLELEDLQVKDKAFEALKGLNPVGFHTYGEQFNGVHINQTISGVAFYEAA